MKTNTYYVYDNLGRLTSAIYGEGAGITSNPDRFNEAVTAYDKMGNIQSLVRRGKLNSGYGEIDNLTYTYNGNKLTKVTDAVTTPVTYEGAFHFVDRANVSNEYAYDANGNMTKDLNKNITQITYNALNLPEVVTYSGGNTITYVYDGAGRKLSVVYQSGGVTTRMDYVANNPVRFIDPQGDTISLYIQGQYYTYGIQNGQAGFIDKSGNMYSGNDSFASSLLSALGSLRQHDRGRELVDYLAGTSGNLTIRNVRNTSENNHATPDGKGVIWDPINTSGGIDINNSTYRPSFIGLGHEMAHIEDNWKGTIDNSPWGNTGIANSEKYATHVENQIRAEHGISLRGSYRIDMSSGSPRIDRGTQIIDVVRSGNNTLYYSKFYKQNISFINSLNNKSMILPGGFPYKY